jgi:secondary thiamine-phosphate synthase enzyme
MHSETLSVPTAHKTDFIDITPLVAAEVEKSGIDSGLVHIISAHTSAGLCVNEFEPGLMQDFEGFLEEWISDDPEDPRFKHNEIWNRPDVPEDEPQNADAHMKAMFMGHSTVLPLKDGKLALGKWQRVLFMEMDGPREREVTIMVQGDAKADALGDYMVDKGSIINEAIEPHLRKSFEGGLLSESRYLTKGGKRLRGSLVLLVCEAFEGDPDKALDAAVAVELLQAASLARDDIQDGDETRRGGLSGWIVYGIRKTLAISDVMTPFAFEMLSKYGREALVVALASWREVGIGQAKDLFISSFRGNAGIYEEIVTQKTGAFFGLAAVLGLIAAEGTKEQRAQVEEYGRELGRMFQIIDDVADLKMGKEVTTSFKKWLQDRDPETVIMEGIAVIQSMAQEFPETPQRDLLVELPQYAYAAMMNEAEMEDGNGRSAATGYTAPGEGVHSDSESLAHDNGDTSGDTVGVVRVAGNDSAGETRP